MNERIRELAEQAHVYVACSNASNLRKLFEKKFAELIIQECATYAFSNDEDYYAMLKHFGVK